MYVIEQCKINLDTSLFSGVVANMFKQAIRKNRSSDSVSNNHQKSAIFIALFYPTLTLSLPFSI